VEQKIPVKKVEIHIYGAKRALKRLRQGSSDEALLSTPRAKAAAPSSPRPSYDRHMSRVRRGSCQTAQKHPVITVLSRFGRIWGSFRALRNETARRGARLAPGSSPFCRFGAIYGVLNASRGLSFDSCHQPLHRMTFCSSPMSLRNWLSQGGVLAAKGARPAPVRRRFVGSERSTAF
jgi:hypothetical protein